MQDVDFFLERKTKAAPARVSGAFAFGNGPTWQDQPYRIKHGHEKAALRFHRAAG
jgi:hypothetical protein